MIATEPVLSRTPPSNKKTAVACAEHRVILLLFYIDPKTDESYVPPLSVPVLSDIPYEDWVKGECSEKISTLMHDCWRYGMNREGFEADKVRVSATVLDANDERFDHFFLDGEFVYRV